ncbi:MAG: ROK family protein [Prevotella sp.]|jgi:glucokinase|nr:ROK family protein [Prevotella sp.]
MEEELKSKVIGVDISIERTTLAIVDIRGNILAEDSFVTSDYQNVSDYVSELSDRLYMLMESNGGYEKIRSIGISAPSASSISGCIINAANLPWKGEIPLAALVRDRMGMAVAVGNDAHVAALGEYTYGSAHGLKDFIIITLGVGIGSCFFSQGREHIGTEGYAGEWGHATLFDNGRQCGCGKKGCIESYVGAHGIVRTAKDLMLESDEPSLMREIEHLNPKIISECCEQGDALAIETFRKTGYLLGLALANYANIINPQAIILTGGISRAGKFLLEPTRESFEDHVFPNMRGKVRIVVSRMDNRERDVLGASALAWEVPEYSLFK